MVKVYLDDIRVAPKGWVQCRWPEEVIELLKTGKVECLSIDHDLDDSEQALIEGRQERTGYMVMLWLEEQVFNDPSFPIPVHISFHTVNPQGLKKMEASLAAIKKIKEQAEIK